VISQAGQSEDKQEEESSSQPVKHPANQAKQATEQQPIKPAQYKAQCSEDRVATIRR